MFDEAFAGFWNADNYVEWSAEGTALRPVREVGVKSVLSAPRHGTVLAPGPRQVSGYAWSGYGAIRQVETSVDGGQRWQNATLERSGRRGWVRFSTPWNPVHGTYQLLARATLERGLQQPRTATWKAKGYGQNGVHSITVTVTARSSSYHLVAVPNQVTETSS